MKFVIEGDPIPKMRARTFVRGKRTMTFDPQHAKKISTKMQLTEQVRSAFDAKDKKNVMEASGLAFNDAFAVTLTFYMPIPKSLPNSQKNAISWGLKHNHKPDVTNMVKFYEDCANGILFPDDSMIVSLQSSKQYSDNPRTEIEVMPIKSPNFESNVDAVTKTLSPQQLKELIYEMEELERICPRSMVEIGECVQEQWFASYCQSLIKFCTKHAKNLSKLAKKGKNA